MSDLQEEGALVNSDTHWLNDETNALAEGIAESIAASSPLPESASSVASPGSTSLVASSAESTAPTIPFGAHVKGTKVGRVTTPRRSEFQA